MKPIFIPVILSLFTFSNGLKAQQPTTALSYLEFIGNQFTNISNDMMGYTSATSHGKSARKVEKKRAELMQTMKEAEHNVRGLKPFKSDVALRDTVASYFNLSHLVLNEDYGKIVNMEEVAEQSYDKMEAYMLAKEMAEDKLDHAMERAQKEYEGFASRNNITLQASSSKLSEKMKQTNNVMKYYNVIYLIFFKSYKDEVYLMDAINRNDVSAIEQTKSSLKGSALDGLKKLMPMASFENDKSLKTACDKLLVFYQYESSDKTNELTDYVLKKEKFEKAQKAMEANRNKTQVEIDNFNKLVKEYNDSVTKYNNLNNELNKKRNDSLNGWNKALLNSWITISQNTGDEPVILSFFDDGMIFENMITLKHY